MLLKFVFIEYHASNPDGLVLLNSRIPFPGVHNYVSECEFKTFDKCSTWKLEEKLQRAGLLFKNSTYPVYLMVFITLEPVQ